MVEHKLQNTLDIYFHDNLEIAVITKKKKGNRSSQKQLSCSTNQTSFLLKRSQKGISSVLKQTVTGIHVSQLYRKLQ